MYIIMYNVIYERIELSGRGLWGLTAFVWTSGSKKPPPRVCHEKKKRILQEIRMISDAKAAKGCVETSSKNACC